MGNILHQGQTKDGLYTFLTHLQSMQPSAYSIVRISLLDWHKRLGHAFMPVVSQAFSHLNLPVAANKKHFVCPDCQKAKSSQLPFKTSHSKSLHPLDLIYFDV